jgi:2-polyprenyl-3-methyl-5-hydroxy-6-metoxy-1,4-benzoquinol methylase
VAKGGRVLEVGADKCELADFLQRRGYEVWVIDAYDNFGGGSGTFDAMRRKYDNIKMIKGFMHLDQELPANYFDAVYSCSVIEHNSLDTLQPLFTRIRECLKPDGYSIHAIDFTIAGSLLKNHGLINEVLRLHNAPFTAEGITEQALADIETFYLSAAGHYNWRKYLNKAYENYPYRKVVSLNLTAGRNDILPSGGVDTATAAAQQKEINRHTWFHAIDFGNSVVSPGRFKEGVPPNWTLFGAYSLLEHIAVAGKKCLDICTMDGIVAFILKSLGAAKVAATDVFNRNSFRLARSILSLDVDYFPDVSISRLEEQVRQYEKFDLITMAGALYHLYDPLSALAVCRKLILPGGLFIIESEAREGNESVLHLNSADENYPEPFTYWIPTARVMIDMLRFCCFEPLAVIKTWHRYTILAKASAPSHISGRNKTLTAIHQQSRALVPEYLDFKRLENDSSPASVITYSGTGGFSELEPKSFTTKFSLQPAARHESNI